MSDRNDPADLKKCLRDARGDAAAGMACDAAFLQAGGHVEQARLFVAADGRVVVVMTKEGKLVDCSGFI